MNVSFYKSKIMNNRVFFVVAGILFAGLATCMIAEQFTPIRAKVTVQVFDEAGKPFPNADVQIGFDDPKSPIHQAVYSKGKTDAHGFFTAEDVCDGGMGGGIKKDGYYDSGFPFKITGEKDGKWLPWNPICKTTLRPIGKPVALYARTVQSQIPALDQPCGFDLEVGDWVAPYGKGVASDFIFTLHQEVRGMQDYDVTGELTFANPLNGLLETPELEIGKYSEFKWERQAPENGYQTKFQLQNSWHKSQGITRSFKFKDGVWDGYFFRVRTVG